MPRLWYVWCDWQVEITPGFRVKALVLRVGVPKAFPRHGRCMHAQSASFLLSPPRNCCDVFCPQVLWDEKNTYYDHSYYLINRQFLDMYLIPPGSSIESFTSASVDAKVPYSRLNLTTDTPFEATINHMVRPIVLGRFLVAPEHRLSRRAVGHNDARLVARPPGSLAGMEADGGVGHALQNMFMRGLIPSQALKWTKAASMKRFAYQ